MRRMKQRFSHMVSTRQILQSARRSIEVIFGKGSLRMSAVLPRPNTPGSRAQHGNGELAEGKRLLAARARLNAVTQWYSRWEYPWVKHGETAGAGGNENMKGVGIVWVGTRDVYASGWKTARVVVLLFPEGACEGFFVKKQPLYYIFTPSHLQI